MVTFARLTAWILVAGLAAVTLSPLDLRPHLSDSATIERVIAYALVGFAFSLAYPRHRLHALALVVAVAGLLELGQMLTQTRHARTPDFLVKALAAGIGLAVGSVLLNVWPRRTARS